MNFSLVTVGGSPLPWPDTQVEVCFTEEFWCCWKKGVPPVIIHFERWDFPWNRPSGYEWVPPFMETPWNPHILKCQRMSRCFFVMIIGRKWVSKCCKVSWLMIVGWKRCLELLERLGMDSWFNDKAENMMLSHGIENITISAYWVHFTNRNSFSNFKRTDSTWLNYDLLRPPHIPSRKTWPTKSDLAAKVRKKEKNMYFLHQNINKAEC